MKLSGALSFVLLALSALEQVVAASIPSDRFSIRRRASAGKRDNDNDSDPQSSLKLDPSQVQTGLEQDGNSAVPPDPNQVASLTSSNNFINFCLTQTGVPLTNGTQIKGGSCNPTIMGRVLSTANLPSAKFQYPANLDTIPANVNFTVQIAINNLETGFFTNATSNFFAAPAQVNDQGTLIGHSHVVIEKMDSLTSTTVPDPLVFAFFKGLNDPAVNGILSTVVTGGLPAGVYRASTINTAANHQPPLASIAQHGSLDDQVYFTVSDDAGNQN
ncbi:hypothetical protein BOTBODRAFT_174202 [Botryobasidium botryosum FD-172 SS1]|uniref:CHRD domain-containing protein n=1 Tax=Botryobasidium botryosum (strain FD-172 SS1) TaxID=930990 RepID=A0A067MJU5_BOTB1|nr:hypothetical protein BOTBODRAFT_174202 [Botryobasidium botryosum FD-172 SS1]